MSFEIGNSLVNGVNACRRPLSRQGRQSWRTAIITLLMIGMILPPEALAAANRAAAPLPAPSGDDPPPPPSGPAPPPGPGPGGCGGPGGGPGGGGPGGPGAGGGNGGPTVLASSIAVPGQGSGGGGGGGGGGTCDSDPICSSNPGGGLGGGGGGWGPGGGNNWGITAGSGGGALPGRSAGPIYLQYGAAYESVDDVVISTPMGNWNQARSYMSNGTGVSSVGNKWLTTTNENYLEQQGSDISLIVNAASAITFTASGWPVTYSAPAGNTLQLEHDSTAKQYIITDTMGTRYDVYNDFTVTNTNHRGKLIEQSTQGWNEQNKDGFEYTYNTAGKLTSILTATGQDYTIAFTYSGDLITKIQVKDGSTVLKQVDYTYYENVTSPSTDLGSTGDLVQVKVSERASDGTLSIIRYTQYRYDSESRLKAVYEHDAVQRIIDELGVTNEADLMKKADTYGTPDVEVFANRRFTYYTANTSTASITTPFSGSENLNSTYGAGEAAEAGFVKSETLRSGCGSCGSSGGITKTYFYLDIAQGAVDQNEVTRLIIEDTEDSDGNEHHRMIQGLNSTGKKIREVFIDDPTGSPTYWCESWKMATSGKPDRVAEYRRPSAHTIVDSASELRDFLDPYNSEGSSWTNDTNTQNASDGYIEVHTYSTEGMKTDSKVKKGRTGTAYYTWAADYGDGDGDTAGDDHANKTLMVASYAYYDKTTTRADGKKTSYSYTFHDTDDTQVKTKTTTLPVISTSQNGSGVATTMVQYIDEQGRLRWTKDGEGYINYYSYHPESGGQALVVIDVNPASPGTDVTSGSSGNWEAWTIGDANNNKPTRDSGLPTALARTTKNYYDEEGRMTRVVEPGGANHYTVYEDDRTIRFPYWDSTNSECLMPIHVTVFNDMDQISETYAVRADYSSISTASSAPTGFSTAPSQSDYVSWTRYGYNDTTGQRSIVDRYHDIPSSGTGTLSTNFYRTVSQTDAMGREEYSIQVISGSTATDRKEQVSQVVYDVRGRVIRTKMGVSGDSAANSHNMTDDYDSYPTMTTISETEYDGDAVGDGYGTQKRTFYGTGVNDFTGSNYHLTYRGHSRGMEPFYMNGSTETPAGPYLVRDVNWLGQVTAQAQYKSNPTWSTVLNGDGYTDYATSTATNRGTLTETSYDDLARSFQANTFAIDTSTGAKGSSLQSDIYYDRLGRVVATQPKYQAATEFAWDGGGRLYQSRSVLDLESTKYSSGVFNYRDPQPHPAMSSMTGGDDKVVILSHSVFDDAGNTTEQHEFDMNHDDTGTSLGIDLSNNDDYVRSSVYMWYDDADRLATSGQYGSGDTATGAGQWKYASVPSRPTTAPTGSSDSILLTAFGYSSEHGRQNIVTNAMGYDTKTFFDDIGRVTWVCENHDDFDPATLTTISDGSDDSKDRVTKTEYDGLGNATRFLAYNGSSSAIQDTVHLYENSVRASWRTNVIFPDSSDTTSSGSDQIKITYHVDGRVSQHTDQRGTVVAHGYNNRRQPESDKVTTLGGSTDGAVRSITRGYDDLGRSFKITSHGNQTNDPDDLTDVVNQVTYTYDDLGRITESEQSHSDAVGASTPSVHYAYDTSSISSVFDDGARLESITYPDGRVLFSDYGANDGFEDRVGATRRLRETDATGIILLEYSRTGTRSVVLTDYQEPNLKLDFYGGTSGTYAGRNRFGWSVDHRWYDYTSSTVDRARYTYGHNYNGDRTWKEDVVAASNSVDQDEFFTYDGLDRLKSADRGDLNGGKTAISTLSFAQDWDLDQLNNWENFTEDSDGNGTNDLDQDRSHNDANETTDIDSSATHVGHDAAGNMTRVSTSSSWSSHYDLIWDAWHRLVKVEDGGNTLAEYEYDAKHRRVVKKIYVSGTLDETRHLYLSQRDQVLEERVDASSNPDRQFTWGTRYIDELALRTRDTDGNGSLDETLYSLHDANWNITALVDTNGSVTERMKYDAYGTSTILDADFSADADNVSDVSWEYRFTSRRFDKESGLGFYRDRYLHAALGRFLRRDRVGNLDGNNLYAAYFVPSSVDPLGMRERKDYTDDEGCCGISDMKLICRTMPSARHFRGLTHCYIGIADSDGNWVETISGQRDETTGNLVFGDSFWDLNWMIEDPEWIEEYGEATQYEHPMAMPLNMNNCDAYNCLFSAMTKHENKSKYNQFTNNSNTLLTTALRTCGMMANFPSSAWGSDDIPDGTGRSCMGMCLGVDNVITAPGYKIKQCRKRCDKFNSGKPEKW